MNFKKHLLVEGQHAFLGASKYHWVNYDEEKLIQSYRSHQAKFRGTRMHEIASELIEMGIKLPDTNQTLNLYVNDAIGFKMQCEVVLFYSFNCYGTADTIIFKKNKLRVHDLKTGETKCNFTQQVIYVALFCLEYDVDPNEIEIELRIYQYDDYECYDPPREEVIYIMSKIKNSDKIIEDLKMEVN